MRFIFYRRTINLETHKNLKFKVSLPYLGALHPEPNLKHNEKLQAFVIGLISCR